MGFKTNLAVGALTIGAAWTHGMDKVWVGNVEEVITTMAAAESVDKCNSRVEVQNAMARARTKYATFPKKVTIAPTLGKDLFCSVEVKSDPGFQQMQPQKTKTTAELAKENPLDKKEFKDWSKFVEKISK
jgi:hypothetical protein